MAIMDLILGEREKLEQVPAMAPQQQQFLMQLLSMLGGPQEGGLKYLQDLFSESPEALERFGAPFKRQFEEETIPGLAEQFAGMGGLSSSGFQQALGQAGASLSEKLASLREGSRQHGLGALEKFTGQSLQAQPFAYKGTAGRSGILPAIGQIAGAAAAFI